MGSNNGLGGQSIREIGKRGEETHSQQLTQRGKGRKERARKKAVGRFTTEKNFAKRRGNCRKQGGVELQIKRGALRESGTRYKLKTVVSP